MFKSLWTIYYSYANAVNAYLSSSTAIINKRTHENNLLQNNSWEVKIFIPDSGWQSDHSGPILPISISHFVMLSLFKHTNQQSTRCSLYQSEENCFIHGKNHRGGQSSLPWPLNLDPGKGSLIPFHMPIPK